MKIILSATVAVVLLAATLSAQENRTEPLPASSTTTPQAVPSDLPLIPETPAATEKPRGTALPEGPKPTKAGKKEKTSSTEATEAELAERIRFREAKTKALRDPAVQAQWQRSTRAEP